MKKETGNILFQLSSLSYFRIYLNRTVYIVLNISFCVHTEERETSMMICKRTSSLKRLVDDSVIHCLSSCFWKLYDVQRLWIFYFNVWILSFVWCFLSLWHESTM